MESFIARWFEFLFNSWQDATLTNYLVIVLTIVIGGWLMSRYSD